VAADEQRSAAENLFDDAECLLHPLVRPLAGGRLAEWRAHKLTRQSAKVLRVHSSALFCYFLLFSLCSFISLAFDGSS
jgi:hypothetical protein